MQKVYIRIRSKEHIAALLAAFTGAQIPEENVVIMIPLGMDRNTVRQLSGRKFCLYADLPFIARENESDRIKSDLDEADWADGMVVKNIDELGLLKDRAYDGEVIGDSFLYAYNGEAIRFYLEMFPGLLFLAPDELTDEELGRLPYQEKIIYKLYGRARVMFTAQSFSSNYDRGKGGRILLESARQDRFIAMDEDYGYSTVYTAEPVSMLGQEENLKWNAVFLDLTTEDDRNAEAVLSAFFLGTKVPGAASPGHHYRGID